MTTMAAPTLGKNNDYFSPVCLANPCAIHHSLGFRLGSDAHTSGMTTGCMLPLSFNAVSASTIQRWTGTKLRIWGMTSDDLTATRSCTSCSPVFRL